MTSPNLPPKAAIQSRPRAVRMVLRDGEIVEGGIFMNDGQALAPYLGSRKGGWVNVMGAQWLGETEAHNHAVLQSDHILLASSIDGDVPVFGTTSAAAIREVKISLENGVYVRGTLLLADKQRLADYLHSCGKFLPVIAATRTPSDGDARDLAVNCMAIRAIRDARVYDPNSMDGTDEAAAAESRASARASTSVHPIQREMVRRDSGSIEVVTEGRSPDRRVGQAYTSPTLPQGTQAFLVTDPAEQELTEAQREAARTLARHWLVQLGVGARLSPPDPRELPANPSLEEIWAGLARRNDMAETELAIQVAAAFKVAVANLDEVSPDALASIPERVARKLCVLPIGGDSKTLIVAVSDPSSMEIEQQLGFVTRKRLQFQVAPPSEIRGALDWHYKSAP